MDMTAPVPLVDWTASDEDWLSVRRRGCGASDVAALLGFDRYRSPWQVWADKTGHPLYRPPEETEAMRLGLALEPWLLDWAGRLIYPDRECSASTTSSRIYAHREYSWRVASPDGLLGFRSPDKPRLGIELVECKMAGLTTGRAYGWTDTSVPLGYEFQTRWQMHVMDAPICHIVALVVGRGLCHYPIPRDLELEADLVEQVSVWWERHIVGGEEPPLTGRDAAVVAALYPKVIRPSVDLDDTDAMMHWRAYLDARQDQTDAEQRKDEAGTALKALIGEAQIGRVEGRQIAAWGERKGRVDWERLAGDLYSQLAELLNITDPALAATAVAWPQARCNRCGQIMPFEQAQEHALADDCQPVTTRLPAIDALAEQFRGPTSRAFTIKE